MLSLQRQPYVEFSLFDTFRTDNILGADEWKQLLELETIRQIITQHAFFKCGTKFNACFFLKLVVDLAVLLNKGETCFIILFIDP